MTTDELLLDDNAPPNPDLGNLTRGARFRGGIDGIKNECLPGWCVDLRGKPGELHLRAVLEGEEVETFRNNQLRKDLTDFLPDAHCGFAINPRRWNSAILKRLIAHFQQMPHIALDLPCEGQVHISGHTIVIQLAYSKVSRRDFLNKCLLPALEYWTAKGISDCQEFAQDATSSITASLLKSMEKRIQWLERERQRDKSEIEQFRTYQNKCFTQQQPALIPPSAPLIIDSRLTTLLQFVLPLDHEFLNESADSDFWFTHWLVQAITSDYPQAGKIIDLFDPIFYLTAHPELAERRENPLRHYLEQGWMHGFAPNILFDPDYYKQQWQDYSAEAINGDPLQHYLQQGAAAHINPHPLFDTTYYLQQCQEFTESQLSPLAHYRRHGGRQRINPSCIFHSQYYLAHCPNAINIAIPLEHYLLNWAILKIDPHPLFDTKYFLTQINYVPQQAPLLEYLQVARKQPNCQTHILFVPNYLAQQDAIILTGEHSPLEQFLLSASDQNPHLLFNSRLYRYQWEVERSVILSDPPVVHYLAGGFNDPTIRPHWLFDPQILRKSQSEIPPQQPDLILYLTDAQIAQQRCHALFDSSFYNQHRPKNHDRELTALEYFLAHPNLTILPDARLRNPFDPIVLHLGEKLLTATDFDAEFFCAYYDDLNFLDIQTAEEYFRNYGQIEHLIPTLRDFFRENRILIEQLPIGFFADDYVKANPDLQKWAGKNLTLLLHYLRVGQHEKRNIAHWQYFIDGLKLDLPTRHNPVVLDRPNIAPIMAILVHVYYGEIWRELAGFIRNLAQVPTDVFVNIAENRWIPQLHQEIVDLCPNAFVHISPNRGRDIGGHLRTLRYLDIQRYQIFVFMHTKNSPHLDSEQSKFWRQTMLAAFAANPEIARESIRLFQKDSSVGIIAAQIWRSHYMGKNRQHCDNLFARFAIQSEHRRLDYVQGTMFMIRSTIVARLFEVLHDEPWEDPTGKGEDFLLDGQLEHAIERVIPALTRQMGYRIIWR